MTMVASGGADCVPAERKRKAGKVIRMKIVTRDGRISLVSIFDISGISFYRAPQPVGGQPTCERVEHLQESLFLEHGHCWMPINRFHLL